LFERLPDLKPRDIIVMTPDIRAYAPHIEAVFGNLQPEDARHIPFTIADNPDRASAPMLAALEKLLQLPDLRITVSDMLDFLEVPALRERFGLAEADLPRLHSWIEGAGVRWGLSSAHRQGFDLPSGLEQNTWMFGMRRMLLGYAVGTNAPWRQIAPYDEIGGLEAALVGPLAAVLEQLAKYWQVLLHPAKADEWCQRILGLSNDFFNPTGSRDRLTQRRLEEVLDQWLNACTDAGLEDQLTLPVVRSAVLNALTDASISQRFLAGKVNFGTLMPMRAIPFKVVCLLGMNDGEYPRSRPAPDFDLMAAPGHYRPGDRS
jgi:exodeoxyribonuclease V gamma subunit